MFGSDMIDYIVFGVLVLIGLGGVATTVMYAQKAKSA
jgi:hypothetical protein